MVEVKSNPDSKQGNLAEGMESNEQIAKLCKCKCSAWKTFKPR